jgi:PKD repeat protein
LEHPTVTYSTAGVYNVTLQVTNGTGSNSVTKTTYINVGTPAQPSVINGLASPCASSTQTYSVTNVPGVTYAWTVPAGWTITTGAGTSSITVTTGTTSGTIQVTPSNTCGNGTARTLSVTITAASAASVSIAAASNPACAGASVTFTPTPTNGGTTPTYSWKVGSTIVGSGSTYTSSALTNGNIVTCIMTSNATCVTGSPATSNAVTMTINPTVIPSVAISTPLTTICNGATTVFTAVPTNGGTTPSYQWKVGATVVGTNSATYSTNALANTNVVTCVMTSNATCASPTTATSNAISMTVNPNVIPSLTITQTTGTNPICAGATATFTPTPSNGGTTPAYQWKIGANNATTGSTFTTTALANGDVVTCVMTSNAACVSPTTATSNGLTMTVTTITPSAGSNSPVCVTSTLNLTSSGGTGYAWSGPNNYTNGTQNPQLSNVASIAAGNYTVTVTGTGGCTATALTNVVITPATVGGSVAAGVTQIILGQSTGNINLTGQTGAVVKWQKRLGSGSWTDIASTSTTYSEIPNVVGIWEYQAVVQNGTCSVVNSASVFIEVLTSNAGAVTGGNTPICLGTSTGILTLGGYTGTIVKWQKRVNGGTWIDITNTSATYSETPSSAGSWEYIAVVNSGTIMNSAPTTIVVNPTTVGGTVNSSTEVCSGNTSGPLNLVGNVGSVLKWQSSVSPFTSWIDITNTQLNYTSLTLTQTTKFRAVVQSGNCLVENATPATITIDSATIGGSVATGITQIYFGSPTGTISLNGQLGTVVKWQKRLGSGSWTDINVTTLTYSETPTSIGFWEYRAVVQNGICSVVNSTSIIVEVIASTAGSVTGGTTPICLGNPTGNLTLGGYTGTIVKWQKRVDNGTWVDITNTSATYSETPSSVGTWDYRAVVLNGVDQYSTSVSIVVIPATVGGTVNSDNTVCAGTSVNGLTLSGNVGKILKWQSAVSPFSTWLDISDTTNTYNTGALTETTKFRAVVQNGSCTIENSVPATIQVQPLPTSSFTYSANLLSVTFTNTSTNATSYSWDFGSSSMTSTAPNPVFTYPAAGQYTVVLTAINGSCTSTSSQTITVSDVGVDEQSKQSMQIFPIPTTGKINIQFVNQVFDNTQLNVIDITGKVVYSKVIGNLNSNHVLELDLSSLTTGVYNIRISDKTQVMNKVIVIER